MIPLNRRASLPRAGRSRCPLSRILTVALDISNNVFLTPKVSMCTHQHWVLFMFILSIQRMLHGRNRIF
uniref:ARAE3 n=1 Tax=Arundo donax TaxID=35708 RepID=A0A0A9CWB1_ARUDO